MDKDVEEMSEQFEDWLEDLQNRKGIIHPKFGGYFKAYEVRALFLIAKNLEEINHSLNILSRPPGV